MSYARFSSDDWQSDVYCYESAEGFVIHVAENKARPTSLPPKIEKVLYAEDHDYYVAVVERDQKVLDIVREAPREKINNPHAGETYILGTEEEMYDTLLVLKASGLHVPQYTIDLLEGEYGPKKEEDL